jgi:hypothetical protein
MHDALGFDIRAMEGRSIARGYYLSNVKANALISQPSRAFYYGAWKGASSHG